MSSHVGRPLTTQEWLDSAQGREYRALADALRSRPLTVAELQRVGELGYRILTTTNVPFTKAEVQREFAALLAIQHLIQLAQTEKATA